MSNIKSIFERLGLLEGSDDNELNFDDPEKVLDADNEILDAFLKAKQDALGDDALTDDQTNEKTNEVDDHLLNALFIEDDENLAQDNTINTVNNIENDDIVDASDLLFNELDEDNLGSSDIVNQNNSDSDEIINDNFVENDNDLDDSISDIIHEIEKGGTPERVDCSDEQIDEDLLDLNISTSASDDDVFENLFLNESSLKDETCIQQEPINDFNDSLLNFSDDDDVQKGIQNIITEDDLQDDEECKSAAQMIYTTDDQPPVDQDTNLNSAKEITMAAEQPKHDDDNFTLKSSDLLSSFINENSDDDLLTTTEETAQGADQLPLIETADEMLAELSSINNSLEAQEEPAVFSDLSIDLQSDISFDDVEEKLDRMIESYERNKLMSIDDIYKKSLLNKDIKSTIFMVEVFTKALPENLPLDVKRESVINIMNASNIKACDMLSDAYKRIDALNKVLEGVVDTTETLKEKNSRSILDLEKRILDLKRIIKEREDFQEEQNTTIEYEIQRIINIVDFIKEK